MTLDRASSTVEGRRDGFQERDRLLAAEAGVRPARLICASRKTRLLSVWSSDGAAVLKTATPRTMNDPYDRRCFAREGRLGLTLRHPHLVATRRCGDGWILLENVGDDARSLLDEIGATGPRAATEVERWIAAIADALAYLHAKGVAHRDVKPGNILLPTNDRPTLIDLGAAAAATETRAEESELIGSPAWMAPEQLRGASVGPSTDIWSLALVALYALSGMRPFAGSADVVLRHRCRDPESFRAYREAALAYADAELRILLERSLSDEPNDRPPARALASLWSARGPTCGSAASPGEWSW